MASTLSQVFRDNPLPLNHIIPLDFTSVHSLPESHVWPAFDGFPFGTTYPGEKFSIPIIDLMDPNAAQLVGHACEKWGAFQLTSHGLPSILTDDVESQTRRLFALPAHDKMKALRLPSGGTGYGQARISPFYPKFMWHEGFTIMGSAVDHARKLWPDDYKGFCDVMENYQKKMKELAESLLHIFLESLNISKEEYRSTTIQRGRKACNTALQLNSYPPCPDPNRAMGLAPHTDSLLFTIVHQSHTSGLQILRDGVGWITVFPLEGALVVNVGDLLHILSNGRYPSVLHRAVVNQAEHRISLAYFYGPPADSLISPLCNLVSSGQQVVAPRYRSVSVKEYVDLKEKHKEKALSLLRL
ncbi:hypothetical protein AAG906_006657 [Vitis piasezkii]